MLAADLRGDDGWEEAVAGCDYVLHVASPFPPVQPKDPDELIVPAREGTLRVLRREPRRRGRARRGHLLGRRGQPAAASRRTAPLTEEDWTDPDNPKLTPYARSKTIAERAAWDLVRERGASRDAWRRSTPARSSARC